MVGVMFGTATLALLQLQERLQKGPIDQLDGLPPVPFQRHSKAYGAVPLLLMRLPRA